jgi:hypothetical protein
MVDTSTDIPALTDLSGLSSERKRALILGLLDGMRPVEVDKLLDDAEVLYDQKN